MSVTRARWIAAACVVLAAMMLAMACRSGPHYPDGTIVITFRTMQLRPTFDDYFFEIFRKFEEANPGVRIEWQDQPFQNYETKLMTAFMGRRPPDVINIPSESMRTYVDAGYLAPLEDLLSDETRGEYVQSLLRDGGMFDDKTYALPWYVTSDVTFGNLAIMRRAGMTEDDLPRHVEELPDFCRRIRDETGLFGVYPIYTEHGTLRQMLIQGGVSPLIDEDRNVAVFNTPRGVEILDFWTGLYKDGLVPSDALTATHRRPTELFKTSRLATLIIGPNLLREVRQDAPDIYESTIVGPQMRWRSAPDAPNLVALHMVAVSSRSRHAEVAAAFAAFVTNGEHQLQLAKMTTVLPSVTAALDDPYFSRAGDDMESLARQFTAEQVRRGTVYRPPPNFRRLNKVFEDTIESVALGRISPADGLARAEREWNAILAE